MFTTPKSIFSLALCLAVASAEFNLLHSVRNTVHNIKNRNDEKVTAPWVADSWTPVDEKELAAGTFADDADDAFIPFVARQVEASPTVSSSVSVTPAASTSISPTASASPSATASSSFTPTPSSTNTATATASASATASVSVTPSATSSVSSSPIPTPSTSASLSSAPSTSPIPSPAPATPSASPSNPNGGNRISFPELSKNGRVFRDLQCLKKPRVVRVFNRKNNPAGFRFTFYRYRVFFINFSDRIIQTSIKVVGNRRIARVQSAVYSDRPDQVKINDKRLLGPILKPNKVDTSIIYKNYTIESLDKPPSGRVCGSTMTLVAFVKICTLGPRPTRICRQRITNIPIKIQCINPCRGVTNGSPLYIIRGVRPCPSCEAL